MRAKINDIETKSWFFKNINKIGKTLANLSRRRKQKIQINKIRDKKGNFTTNTIKSRGSLGNTSKICTQINWKIQKKWTHFLHEFDQPKSSK
jgi:hypothetical protein